MRNKGWLTRVNSPLTFRPADAGAMPWTACVLAVVEALDDRASAADGGVSLLNARRLRNRYS
jgi:hypothetical protein